MSSPTSTKPGESRDALASLQINRQPEARSSGRWWKVLLTLAILGCVGWFGYQYANENGMLGSQSEWVPEIMQQKIDVRTERVQVKKGRSADAVVVATGYLESRRQARIGARAAGQVDIIDFEEGDRVVKGEVLAELEHKDLEASLSARKASVTRARSALSEQMILIEQATVDKERAERLWTSKSFSKAEYDQTRFTYLSAVARKNSLQSELSLAIAQQQQAEQLKENMYIRAPFDGTVISKDAEVGESIMPGGMGGGSGRGSVATIADLENLEIECDVQEDFISRVKEGQEAEIAVDAVQDKKYHGKVRKIIPMGDRARATIKVKVAIVDADELLFPEMAGTVFFLPNEQDEEVSDEPRMFCSSSAIETDDDGNRFVWVPDADKRAKKLPVEIGDERDGKTEIMGGLTGKERVIVNPVDIEEGSALSIGD
jgi:RND family efflux transporter MFP subunit